MAELQVVKFDKIEKKIERTHVIEGKVIFCEDTVTNSGTPGVSMQIEGVPYRMRVLKNSIIGAGNAATLMSCLVKLTGVMEDYKGQMYFRPKDCTVTKQSGLAKIAAAKVAFAGDLD